MMAALPQVQHCQQLLKVGLVRFLVIEQHGEDYVLLDRQFRDQVEGLEDKADVPPAEDGQLLVVHGENVPAVYQHLTGSGRVQRADHVEERTFARAGFADYRDVFALGYGKAHVFQGSDRGLPAAVGLTNIFDF